MKKKRSPLRTDLILLRLELLSMDRTIRRLEQRIGIKPWGMLDQKRHPKT